MLFFRIKPIPKDALIRKHRINSKQKQLLLNLKVGYPYSYIIYPFYLSILSQIQATTDGNLKANTIVFVQSIVYVPVKKHSHYLLHIQILHSQKLLLQAHCY